MRQIQVALGYSYWKINDSGVLNINDNARHEMALELEVIIRIVLFILIEYPLCMAAQSLKFSGVRE